MQVSNLLTTFDKWADYVPVLSTANSLIGLFQKYVVIPRLDKQTILNNRYFVHLSQKSWHRSVVALVPILGNIAIALYDLSMLRYSNKAYMLAAVKKDGSALKDASEKLRNDEDVVRAAIGKAGYEVFGAYGGQSLKDNKQFMLKLVRENGANVQYASERLRNDEEMAGAALKERGLWGFRLLGERLRNDRDFVRPLLLDDPHGAVFRYMSDRLKLDKALIIDWLRLNPYRLDLVDQRLLDDGEFILAAMKIRPDFIRDATQRLKGDSQFMLAAIQIDRSAFYQASKALRQSSDFVLRALKLGAELFAASKELKNNGSFMLAAAAIDQFAYQHISEQLRGDRSFMLAMADIQPFAPLYASEDLKDDKDFVRAIIQRGQLTLSVASSRLRNDAPFVIEILEKRGMDLKFASDSLKANKVVVLIAIRQNAEALYHAAPSLQDDEEVVLAALDVAKDKEAILKYASQRLQEKLKPAA